MTLPIIIVGGSGGIGSAVARRLAASGRALHLIGRDAAKLSAVAAETGASHAVADVGDREALTDAIAAAGGALDGLVYAVGSITLKPLARLNDDDIERDFRLNALGAFRAVQLALPALKANPDPSSVVLFSSIAVTQGFTSHASIGMAKGAVEGLTLALAAELAPKVRVNAVAPSLTRTPLSETILPNDKTADAIAALHALPRLGTPEDLAALTAFLVSEEADWITGQIFGVDGGRSTLRVGS
jgi:NAD(P)-dependent dehydrogenase (short-subunit alcohol dehydrogenase family)